jgi:Asp-tRNA(Asn)/Glu-tRNA(Gln) amidotransferase A subunit family amidase
MSAYNLNAVQSPRLCGWQLSLFAAFLQIPIIGNIFLQFMKKKNKMPEMLCFAETAITPRLDNEDGNLSSQQLPKPQPQPLLPLYYPVHEMTEEEKEMHQKMAKDVPLDLSELASMGEGQHPKVVLEGSGSESGSDENGVDFRHWTFSDYTTRYLDQTTTPSIVVEKLIQAIEEMNDPQNKNRSKLVIHMNVDDLRSQAAESTKRYESGKVMGILDGIPILIKDQIPTVGFPHTYGTSFQFETVKEDICSIVNLKQEGVLIVGKTNQHEIGLGTTGFNMTYGTPRNPYGKYEKETDEDEDGTTRRQLHYFTGGSSSGSAAAVAMGLVPLALGTDGGGSIRIPAGLCGCVGLKPTFQRIPSDSFNSSSLFHLGPMTNNIHDAALAYAIMAGRTESGTDHHSRPLSWNKMPPVHLHGYMKNSSKSGTTATALKGLRIGIFEDHINDADDNVVSATKNAIEYFKSQGAQIVPIDLPHLQEIHIAHACTILTEMYDSIFHHKDNWEKLSLETRVSLSIGKAGSSSEFRAAQKMRRYAMHQIENLFRKVDILLSPATPCCAPLVREDTLSHGENNTVQTTTLMRYAIHGNLTGIPGLVFPIGYDEETALPISLQIQAAHWREDLLLHVAKDSMQGILKRGVAKPTLYVDMLGADTR